MYNDGVTPGSYEIRICNSCGLRYPLAEGHPFGTRCPVCVGETRAVLNRHLVAEPKDRGKVKAARRTKIAVLLDNIRSAWNVGSVLRSADGFGFSHAYLCGITPTADHEAVTKTSLGAEISVPWSYHKDALRLVKGLKAEGWRLSALEEDARAISIDTPTPYDLDASREGEILIMGNEVTGVDPDLLDLCDQIFYIPMYGEKRSFNVAIAFSIAAYTLSIQRVNG